MTDGFDPQGAFVSYMRRPPIHIDGSLEGSYSDLEHIPGKGVPYELRHLAFARPGDSARVTLRLHTAARALLMHYRRIGIATLDEEMLRVHDTAYTHISPDQSPHVSVFMYHEGVCARRGDTERLRVTLQHEHKCAFAERWGTHEAVPKTMVIRGTQSSDVPDVDQIWRVMEGPMRLKSDRSASGGPRDNLPVNSWEELKDALPLWGGRDYVIQRAVGEEDASIGFYADEERVYPLYITKQVMSGTGVHEGNYVCFDRALANRILHETLPIAQAMQAEGFRDFFGFDVRATKIGDNQYLVWIIECNARTPAPAYGWFLAQRTRAPWWCVMNLKNMQVETLPALFQGGLMFNHTVGAGAICHNLGPLAMGYRACSITVLAPDEARGMSILRAVQARAAGNPPLQVVSA